MEIVNRNEDHWHVCQAALFLKLHVTFRIKWKDWESYITVLQCNLQFNLIDWFSYSVSSRFVF